MKQRDWFIAIFIILIGLACMTLAMTRISSAPVSSLIVDFKSSENNN